MFVKIRYAFQKYRDIERHLNFDNMEVEDIWMGEQFFLGGVFPTQKGGVINKEYFQEGVQKQYELKIIYL